MNGSIERGGSSLYYSSLRISPTRYACTLPVCALHGCLKGGDLGCYLELPTGEVQGTKRLLVVQGALSWTRLEWER